MVSINQPYAEIEPTPEFNDRCLEIVFGYNRGELPFKETITLLNQLRQEAVEDRHIVNQGRVEQLLGYVQHYRGNLNTSIEHNERARSLYQRAGNMNRVAAIDLNQGENYRFKGDFNRALRLYRAAFEHSQVLGTQTMASVNEGLVLVTLKQDELARKAFETGLDLISNFAEEDSDPSSMLCEIHHGLAVINLREGRFQEAWDHALLALEAANTNGEPLQYGHANRTLGEVITELHEAPDSRFSSDPDEYFHAALDAFREINAEAEMAKTMFAQALSLAARGRRTTAARKLQQVMIIFTRLEMVDDAARAAEAQLAVI